MTIFKTYDREYLLSLTNKRDGETKFGEKVQVATSIDTLATSDARYVLIGIPEDVGVRANHGRPGTASAWNNTLKALLNIQSNAFTQPEKFLILGIVDCEQEMLLAISTDNTTENYHSFLGKLVSIIDEKVTFVIQKVVEAGKIPIVIGGGHNNSYGNIKGSSQALGKPIHVLNFDAHSDFRYPEYRHSGNGFSYAFDENFLKNYFIFGLHQNYTSKEVFERLNKNSQSVRYCLFEDICVKGKIDFDAALEQADSFVTNERFGLEIDLDALQNIPASAKTPSGFSVNELRRFVSFFSKNKNLVYVHICEAAPKPNSDEEILVGKLISYLITDIQH